MSGASIVIDTNIVVHVFEGNADVLSILAGRSLVVSVLTRMELYAWPKITVERRPRVDSFLDHCRMIGLPRSVQEEAVRLRRLYSIEMVDAIIVATSVVHGMPFVTADKKLFKLKEDVELHAFKP